MKRGRILPYLVCFMAGAFAMWLSYDPVRGWWWDFVVHNLMFL